MQGVIIVATKSILKTVHIKDKKLAKNFLSALEDASGSVPPKNKSSGNRTKMEMTRSVKRDDINKFFEG